MGLGTVGGAMYRGFAAAGCVVLGYDIDPARSRDNLEATLRQKLILVSVPAPEMADGDCDLSSIRTVFEQAARLGASGSFVLRSTVPVGTTDRLMAEYPALRIGFSPEFLRTASADFDFINPPMTVYGGGDPAPFFEAMKAVYGPGANRRQILLRTREAEFLKLFLNGFAAIKAVFSSELAASARSGEMNWESIVEAAGLDERLGKGYLAATGPDNLPGFAGKCLPKDCRMLVRQLGSDSLLAGALKINERIRSSPVADDSLGQTRIAAPAE